jgi:replication factor A3
MAEPVSTPRVNSHYLDSFTNQTVRLVGKVVQLRGEKAIIFSQGHVTAHLNRVGCSFYILSFLQFV